jgi:hypothetical protein
MKEKIKTFIYNTLIFYSLFIVVLILINMFSIKTKVELNDNETNIERLSSLKEKVSKLEENSCTTLINDMIKSYEKTSFNGEIELTRIYEIYWNGPSFINYYPMIKEKCNMSDEFMENLGIQNDVMNSITYIDNILNNSMFSYEIKLPDKTMRDIAEANITQIEYKTCKSSELDVIEKTLNNIGGVSNE